MIEPKIAKKAYRCRWTWNDVWIDRDIVWANKPSEARYKFYLNSECMDTILNVRCKRAKDYDLVENPNPSDWIAKLTPSTIDKMCHAIGHDYKKEPYRNRYVVNHDEEWEYLIQNDLAVKRMHLEMNVYHLTDKGIQVILSSKPIFRQQYDYLLSANQPI